MKHLAAIFVWKEKQKREIFPSMARYSAALHGLAAGVF